MKESSLIDGISKYLKTVPHCCFEKRHGGMYGKAGQPDISGCVNGVRFEIEAKVPGNRPTALQFAALEEWARAGAWCIVAYSVDDVRKLIVKIMAEENRK